MNYAHKNNHSPAGWLYMLAGIVLVFVAYFVDPELIAALIFVVIGLGLLAAGFGMMGIKFPAICNLCCDGSCRTEH